MAASDITMPNGKFLADIVANLNSFATLPTTSRGAGEILHYSGDNTIRWNSQTTNPTTNPTWSGLSAGGTKKIFFPWSYTVGTEGTDGVFACVHVPASTGGVNIYGNIQIPPDFISGAKVYAIIKPEGTGTGYIALIIEYGSIGEAPNTHTTFSSGPLSMTNGLITKSDEVSLTSAVAGDFVGVNSNSSALYSIAYEFFGFVLEYTA